MAKPERWVAKTLVADQVGKSFSQVLCYCGFSMKLRRSPFGFFYGCSRYPDCDGLVGIHQKGPAVGFADGIPAALGTVADQKTREERMRLHDIFDKFWSSPRERRRCYRQLADDLGIEVEECHIGNFDAETCLRAAKAIGEW